MLSVWAAIGGSLYFHPVGFTLCMLTMSSHVCRRLSVGTLLSSIELYTKTKTSTHLTPALMFAYFSLLISHPSPFHLVAIPIVPCSKSKRSPAIHPSHSLPPGILLGRTKKKKKGKKVSLQQEFSKRATWRTLHSVDVGANLFPHKLQRWLNWLLSSSSLNHAGYLIDNEKNSKTGDDRHLSGWKWLEIIKMFFTLRR